MICVYSALLPPIHSVSAKTAPFATVPSARHQTSARSGDGLGSEPFRICLGTFGNPLGGLDMHQIEVGFLYVPCVGGWREQEDGEALQKGESSEPSRQPCPHPLVTERGGDAVNYRRAWRHEQWFICFGARHSPQHRHSIADVTVQKGRGREDRGEKTVRYTPEDLRWILCIHIID